MLSNPFDRKIIPAAETDVDQNAELFAAILGPVEADQYRALVAGENKQPRQKSVDIGARAKEALASQSALLSASAERQAEHFLTKELKNKFEGQTKSLIEVGFLETNEKGETGVTGIDGEFYQLPTPEQVSAYFIAPERKAFIEKKVGQGFTRLLITPFAAPIDTLTAKTAELIKKQKAAGNLKAEDGTDLILDATTPLGVSGSVKGADVSGNMIYNVKKFDKVIHGGNTKKEILSDTSQPFLGFRIQLLQEDLTIPRSGAGTTIKDRPNLEAGKSPNDYLAITQDPTSPYHKEHGLTPEDWLSLFSTTLHETGIAIDNYADDKNTAVYLTGSYNSTSDFVPRAYWFRVDEQAYLDRSDPTYVGADDGVRVAVG